MADGLNEGGEKVCGDSYVDAVDQEIYASGITGGAVRIVRRTLFGQSESSKTVKGDRAGHWDRHDIGNHQEKEFFFELVFPVVVFVDRKIVLFTPLPVSYATSFLLRDAGAPLIKKDLMNQLL